MSDEPTEEITIEFSSLGVKTLRKLIAVEDNNGMTLDRAIEVLAQIGIATMHLMDERDIRLASKVMSLAVVRESQQGEGFLVFDFRDLFRG